MKLSQEQKQLCRELSEFYAKAAESSEINYEGITCNVQGPNLASSPFEEYELIPTKKPVDLSVLIDSSIDCEFSDNEFLYDNFGVLAALTEGNTCPYHKRNAIAYKYCRPRLNRVHAWMPTEDSVCPLPEGFIVRVYLRNGDEMDRMATDFNWSVRQASPKNSNIIAFKVKGLAEHFCWPWECEE